MNNISSLPTVTVAISAHNEEQNIKAFLSSVLSQKQEGFILKHLWVYDDGSTDATVQRVKEIESPILNVIHDNERIGKSSRLNTIYANLDTDYLVQSDADVVFSHPLVIRDIISPLIRNPRVGMCGGHPEPIPAITFTERAVNCTCEAFMKLRSLVRDGNNILSVDGRLLSYRKEVVKKVMVPTDMIANDAYTYFCCLSLGYQYRYVATAVVQFRSPTTLKDQIRQNTRFLSAADRMRRYFPKNLVDREYFIPRMLLMRVHIQQLLRHPILCCYIFVINRYCKLKAIAGQPHLTATWDIAGTTKDHASSRKSKNSKISS